MCVGRTFISIVTAVVVLLLLLLVVVLSLSLSIYIYIYTNDIRGIFSHRLGRMWHSCLERSARRTLRLRTCRSNKASQFIKHQTIYKHEWVKQPANSLNTQHRTRPSGWGHADRRSGASIRHVELRCARLSRLPDIYIYIYIYIERERDR